MLSFTDRIEVWSIADSKASSSIKNIFTTSTEAETGDFEAVVC